MQKADCGLNISGSCFWDNEVDGTVTIKWDAPTLICIVNVFGCALWFHNSLLSNYYLIYKWSIMNEEAISELEIRITGSYDDLGWRLQPSFLNYNNNQDS